jgi:hypothetical protein
VTDPDDAPDDAARAEIRAYLRAHPELSLREIIATVLRDLPVDEPDFRPIVSAAWAAAEGDVGAFWAGLERDHPGAAAALTDTVLVPMIIEVARQERAPG